MLRETRRNLDSAVSEHPIMHQLLKAVVSTHICEILLGITLKISALKLPPIALGVESLFNLISRYLNIPNGGNDGYHDRPREIFLNLVPDMGSPGKEHPRGRRSPYNVLQRLKKFSSIFRKTFIQAINTDEHFR